MTYLKKLSILALTFASLSSFAEHDGIYCGTIKKDTSGKALLVLDLDYQVQVGAFWEEEYVDVSSKAIIYYVNDQKKALELLKTSKEDTVFCAQGRWAGAYYTRNLSSDSISRFDYASNFSKAALGL